jgi:hypothetical protein
MNRFIVKDKVKPLGRWNIEYCNTKMNQKIDLSNEDHCGPCGQYAITKISESESDKIDIVQKIHIIEPIKK